MYCGNQEELNINTSECELQTAGSQSESRTSTGACVISGDGGDLSTHALQNLSYQRLEQHLAKPARNLPLQVIWELGQKLHESRGRVGNWVNLAENLGYDRGQIELFIIEGTTCKETPGYMMLLDWTKQERGRSMFVLVEMLRTVGRLDCVQFLLQKIEEMMFMFLFVHIVDETSPHSTSQHLKVRTMCDLSIKDSLENLLAGNSDDYEYELVDVALHEKAVKFKGEEITLRRKYRNDSIPSSSLPSSQKSDKSYPHWKYAGFSGTFSPSLSSLDSTESLQQNEISEVKKNLSIENLEMTKVKVLESASYENFVHTSSRYVNVERSLYQTTIPKQGSSVDMVQVNSKEEGVEDKSMTVQISTVPNISDLRYVEGQSVSRSYENQNRMEISNTLPKNALSGKISPELPALLPTPIILHSSPNTSALSPEAMMQPTTFLEPQQMTAPSIRSSLPCQQRKSPQMAAQSFPASPIQERKIYVTDECVYCGKIKTTELKNENQHLNVTCGAHCPSCRCRPLDGTAVLLPTNQQPGRTISSQLNSPTAPCDQVQPISDNAISSTTNEEADSERRDATKSPSWSSHTGLLYIQQSPARASNSPEPMESECPEWQENPKPQSTFQVTEGNIPSDTFSGNVHNFPSACSRNMKETVIHQDQVDLFAPGRKRCNTDPGGMDMTPSPDSCIAMAHSAFRLMASDGSEKSSRSMEQIHEGVRSEADGSTGRSTGVKAMQLTLHHVNDLLRNFPGWNAHVDERNVEKIMSPVCREDGHYIVWFMRSKSRIVLSVSHLGKLIHYAIYAELNRQRHVDFHIFDERFSNLRSLLRHYQNHGLSPQTEQGQGHQDGFIHEQNLRESRRLARLSHVQMKFAYAPKGDKADPRRSV